MDRGCGEAHAGVSRITRFATCACGVTVRVINICQHLGDRYAWGQPAVMDWTEDDWDTPGGVWNPGPDREWHFRALKERGEMKEPS
jgi:hypothetical protein